MKTKFLSMIAVYLMILAIGGCKKEEPCPVAFNYTIIDSTTLQPLIGYHSSARYDPELFEFQMNVKAEKNISYQIREDSGAVFTIRLSNILEKNIISNSYVFYGGEVFDTLGFISTSPAPEREAIVSMKAVKIGHEEINESMARMNCVNNYPVIDTLKIKQ